MNILQIETKIHELLNIVQRLLALWLSHALPKISGEWWIECVLSNLNCNQRENIIERDIHLLEQLDLLPLLKITDKVWLELKSTEHLSNKERSLVHDMIKVRNNWAVSLNSVPGKDAIVNDAETIKEFLLFLKADKGDIVSVDSFILEIQKMVFDDSSDLNAEKDNNDNKGNIYSDKEISVNSMVSLVSDPSVIGIVRSVKKISDIYKYQVFINGKEQTLYSGQIILLEENTDEHNWIKPENFRNIMTAYQINNPANNNLYSLNSARIDFVPYQFRPALKMIHSDEPKILIADSVGVGKTIEAGLIIKELQARQKLENILIICPKPLVTERKWELEMKRFDEEFVPVKGDELRQIISDTDRDGKWPSRYSKLIIPYSILDSRTYSGDNNKRIKSFGLKDLEIPPHFDLVIVDEAHNIRNGSMEKEKAFAYKCVKYFCDNADAVVFLTATPLQTSDNDLFTLLNLLRPDIVIDKNTFDMMSRPNKYISKCSSILRRADENWKEDAAEVLKDIRKTQWGENVVVPNPVYEQVIETLEKQSVSREERVKLISDVESLHSFNTIINRTRRKDIQDFCIRRSYTLETEFTDLQRKIHDLLLRFEHDSLLELHGSANSISFMMTTLKRQAASCIFGLKPHLKDILERRFNQLSEDFDTEIISASNEELHLLKKLASELIILFDKLPDDDPKFDDMLKVVSEKQSMENNRIIIFSTFRHTLRYLETKLTRNGYRVARIDGDVDDKTRQEYKARFELDKDDENSLDILLFTEVGSEGLDYQCCDTMINYDLPWNPMRIEQRIGRIDRRGQKSEAVNIYNLITPGTVDASIYYRCLMRIGIFERSIGECDHILGEITTEIDSITADSGLTEEEKMEKLEYMADNKIRKIQELNRLEDEEKELFGIDLSEFSMAQDVKNAENPWINPESLIKMIEDYFYKRLGKGLYFLGDSTLKHLRLSSKARSIIYEDLKRANCDNNMVYSEWKKYLTGTSPMCLVTFDSETAADNRDAVFITPMHPLVKQAALTYYSDEVAYIKLRYSSESLPEGLFYFSVYAWEYTGVSSHTRLMIICENENLASELPDIILQSVPEADVSQVDDSMWDELESIHVAKWLNEKKKYTEDNGNLLRYKEESITTNYRIRKRNLEQKLASANAESMKTMFSGELKNMSVSYENDISNLHEKQSRVDIHTSLIANGVIEIGR